MAGRIERAVKIAGHLFMAGFFCLSAVMIVSVPMTLLSGKGAHTPVPEPVALIGKAGLVLIGAASCLFVGVLVAARLAKRPGPKP